MWEAAKALNRDPLAALGVPGDLTPERADFTLRMENPLVTQEQDEMREAQALHQRVRAEEAWEAALPGGAGYQGARSSEVKRDGR